MSPKHVSENDKYRLTTGFIDNYAIQIKRYLFGFIPYWSTIEETSNLNNAEKTISDLRESELV